MFLAGFEIVANIKTTQQVKFCQF